MEQTALDHQQVHETTLTEATLRIGALLAAFAIIGKLMSTIDIDLFPENFSIIR